MTFMTPNQWGKTPYIPTAKGHPTGVTIAV